MSDIDDAIPQEYYPAVVAVACHAGLHGSTTDASWNPEGVGEMNDRNVCIHFPTAKSEADVLIIWRSLFVVNPETVEQLKPSGEWIAGPLPNDEKEDEQK